jgi:hypothetical protein
VFHTRGLHHNGSVTFVHQSWPAEPRQLAPIRAEIRRWLGSLGVGEHTETGMVLAVNEAVTNAINSLIGSTIIHYYSRGTRLRLRHSPPQER